MGSNVVGIVAGPRTSFLDHIIPLCARYDAPLVCTDSWVKTCAELYYPEMEIIEASQESFQQVLEPFDTLLSVEPCRLHSHAYQFGEFLYHGEAKTICGFHGNPMKFRGSYWIERYAHEDRVLVYGEHLERYFQEKGVKVEMERIGNIRYAYYQDHKAFFDRICMLEPTDQKTVLWAPTWSFGEGEDDSPFFAQYEQILQNVPEKYRLVVKLHPFMFRLYPEKVTQIREKYTHVHFFDETPLVYPILSQVDLFLGDYSSMVYDFLVFDRPVFFTGNSSEPFGKRIDDLSQLDQPDDLSKARRLAYDLVFFTKKTI